MELRTHTDILKKQAWFIVAFTVIVAIAAGIFAWTRPESYKAVVSFEVTMENTEIAQSEFGSYYDLKGAELFSQHLISLLRTPAVVQEIYAEAGQNPEIKSLTRYTARFRGKQYSPQNVVVEFTDPGQESAQTLGQAVVTVMERRAPDAGNISGQPVFTVSGQDPVIAPGNTDPWIVVAIGAVIGLLGSLILVYIREYFTS